MEEEKKKEEQKVHSAFISGLPYETTDEDIKSFFSAVGNITKITLPRYQDTGRAIGYAHVEFSNEESLDQALKMTGQKMGSRYLIIQPSKGKGKKIVHWTKPPEGCKTVFVKGLPYDITEEEVGDLFVHCGAINAIRFTYNSVTKQFKGFCYIEFTDPLSVKKAVEMNGKEVQGRNIFVDYDEGQQKKGYKYRTEQLSKYNKKVKKVLDKKKKAKEKPTEEGGPERKKKKLQLLI